MNIVLKSTQMIQKLFSVIFKLIFLNGDNIKFKTTVSVYVLRETDGYGDNFDSLRSTHVKNEIAGLRTWESKHEKKDYFCSINLYIIFGIFRKLFLLWTV